MLDIQLFLAQTVDNVLVGDKEKQSESVPVSLLEQLKDFRKGLTLTSSKKNKK